MKWDVTNISWRTTIGATLGGFAYEYDALGRIVLRSHALGGPSQSSPMSQTFQRTYSYDDFDRLASDGDVAYTYDAAGNRMTRTENGETITYTLGVGDRLASYGRAASTMPPHSGAYTHDIAGNVTRIERDGRPTLDLTWNSQYQLVSVSTNGAFAESYAYDALNRRVATTTLEGTTRHVYDDNWQVIADIDEQGNVVASYVWGEGIDRLLAVSVGDSTYYALTDIQGTVWGYVDEYNNIVARWTYDAWGNVLSEYIAPSASVLAQIRYRFQGREWSAATGLVNFRMRWYDAETGRWLSKDPIGLNGGLNLYVFCKNNSVGYYDPLGAAKVGNRGLHGMGALLTPLGLIPGMVIPMRLTNTFPEHRHIFFDDGTNIGWGPDGFFCDEDPSDGYTMKGSNYDDDLLRKAVDNVKPGWGGRGYSGLSHNCQDFVEAVLNEYERLLEHL